MSPLPRIKLTRITLWLRGKFRIRQASWVACALPAALARAQRLISLLGRGRPVAFLERARESVLVLEAAAPRQDGNAFARRRVDGERTMSEIEPPLANERCDAARTPEHPIERCARSS